MVALSMLDDRATVLEMIRAGVVGYLVKGEPGPLIVDAIANREGMRAEFLAREHARIARRNLDDALKNRESVQLLTGAGLFRL